MHSYVHTLGTYMYVCMYAQPKRHHYSGISDFKKSLCIIFDINEIFLELDE